MAMDGGNDDDDTGSGPSPPGRSNEDDTSVGEAQELLRDRFQREREFYEADQAEDSDMDDDYSESGTDRDMPAMVGRMKDDESSDDNSGNGSYKYHTDNDNSSLEDSDDCAPMPGLQERSQDDSSSDNSLPVRAANAKPPTAKEIPHSIDIRYIIPPWMSEKVVKEASCHQRYQQKATERNFLEAKRADTPTGFGIESRPVSTLRNGRVPQQKAVPDSIDETVSGFEPRAYRPEQSNLCLPLGLKPKTLVNKQL